MSLRFHTIDITACLSSAESLNFPPRPVDRKNCIEKEQKFEQKQPPRSLHAGTAQRGAPIFYHARADRIFSHRVVSARVSPAPLKQAVSALARREKDTPRWRSESAVLIWLFMAAFSSFSIKFYAS